MVAEYTALAKNLRDHFVKLLREHGLRLVDCLTTADMFSVVLPVPSSSVEVSPTGSEASPSSEVTGMHCF